MDGIAYECKRCGHLHLVAHHQGYCSRCLHDDYRVVEVDIVKRGTLGKFDRDIVFGWAKNFTNSLEKSAEVYERLSRIKDGYFRGRHEAQAETYLRIAQRIREDVFGKEEQDGERTAARHKLSAGKIERKAI